MGDLTIAVGASRYMAECIAGSKCVEFPGDDHLPWGADADVILDEIEEFLTGERQGPEPDRILATILFTDIVGSTDRAAELGDHRWRDLLENFYGVVRRELPRFRGVEINMAGDGMLATFDGPARGVRCARSIADAVRPLGVQVRSGLHTGECELIDDDVSGIAVHTAVGSQRWLLRRGPRFTHGQGSGVWVGDSASNRAALIRSRAFRASGRCLQRCHDA